MVHTFHTELTWELLQALSRVDRFAGEWASIERREGRSLKHLKSIATIQSVGASTRIEGSRLDDAAVDALLAQLDITKLEDRDQQEVAGYFEALDTLSEAYADIRIGESELKHLHKLTLQYSTKDAWHRGGYKQRSNAVEATLPDGSRTVVFTTTPPGVETEDAMRALVAWYGQSDAVHPLVRVAAFCYEFVTIHPFQDGNGRLSRLLATLLLLQQGYPWVQYVSFEHEIERRKKRVLPRAAHLPGQPPGRGHRPLAALLPRLPGGDDGEAPRQIADPWRRHRTERTAAQHLALRTGARRCAGRRHREGAGHPATHGEEGSGGAGAQ